MKKLAIYAALCLPGAAAIFAIGCAFQHPIIGATAACLGGLVAFLGIILVCEGSRFDDDA